MKTQEKHNYTKSITCGNWLVEISPDSNYGYFENQNTGAGGGLWFDSDKCLMDYDGVFELSKHVIQCIESLDYNAEYAKC